MKKTFSVLIATLFLFSASVNAEVEREISGKKVLSSVEPEDLEISQKAKSHQYPGGKDEGELKVQSQLAQPHRKMGVVEEADHNSADD